MIDTSADRFILKNAQVLTADGNDAVQASIGVSRGRIAAVGDLEEVRTATGRGAVEIDLEGAMALPGFWESHIHLVDGALFLAQIDLRGCETPAAIAARLHESIGASMSGESGGATLKAGGSKAGELKAGERVIGHGWADLAFPPGVVPNRRLLDELVPSHPAVLTSRDGHSAWLNTAALKLLKVASWRLPPQEMPLDDSGQPVGMLYENGVNRVNQMVRRSLSAGYRMEVNSDWPYGGGVYPPRPGGSPLIGFEPLLGIHAVSSPLNANSGETIRVSQAIRGFTATPAFANWREGDLGSLEPGKRADIVALSRNILACPVDELLKTEVLLTILEGRIVHQNVG
ncbi:MAG: amidohydrolase family protein [Firmicutes bacterium]|nr:amidohydrolase family protein [Bacillota bacterium]